MFLRLQTQRYVRVYDLREQKLVKTLLTGVKWLSSMAVHPTGQSCWRHRFQPPKPRISFVFLCLCFKLLTVAYSQHLLLIFLSFLALLIIIASVLLLQTQHKGRRRRACAKPHARSCRDVTCLAWLQVITWLSEVTTVVCLGSTLNSLQSLTKHWGKGDLIFYHPPGWKIFHRKDFYFRHFAAGNCSCSAVSVVFASNFHKLQNHFIFTFFSGTIKKRFGVWRFTVVIRSSHPPATTARLSSATEKSTS